MARSRLTPNDIRITDLAHPVLTSNQKAVLAAADRVQVEFDPEVILAEARTRTGLSDFGDEGFRERFDIWVQSLAEDENLSSAGRIGTWSDTVRYAANRLRLEDLILRHPEILDIQIEKPIIIIGLPRSGTTHLLNLISADSRLRSLPYWESLEPVRAPEDEMPSFGRRSATSAMPSKFRTDRWSAPALASHAPHDA